MSKTERRRFTTRSCPDTSIHQHSTSLSKVQRSHNEVEEKAQIIASRIKIFRLKEQRAVRRVEETHKKTQDVQFAKVRKKQKQAQRDQLIAEQKRQEAVSRQNLHRMRETKRATQGLSQQALTHRRHRTASVMKRESLSHRERKAQLLSEIQLKNQEKAQQVQVELQRGLARIQQFRYQKYAAAREIYLRKLSSENQRARQREREVMDMELMEMELLEKLKTTQMMQQQAYDALEMALR